MTNIKEITKMSDTDLVEFVKEKREVLRGLRFGKAERNTNTARAAKTDIARALTVQNDRVKTPATK